MPSLRRRALAFLALGAALLLALLASGLFPQEPVRRRVEARLRALLGPGARIGRLSVEPGRLRARIDGLVLEGPTYRLEVDHLELRLAAATLRGRVLDLRELKARGVRLVLRPGPATSPSPAGAPGQWPPVSIGALDVEDANVRYHDPALNGDVVFEGVSLHGAIGAGTLEVAARGGRWERPPEVPLAPVRARLRLDPQLVTQIEAFEAGLPRSRVYASGTLGPLLDPSPDLRVQATLELDELGPLGGPGDMHGTVDLAGTVRGARELHASAIASAKALRLQGWPVDAAQLKIEHAPGGTSGSLEATLLGGRANGEGRWDGARVEGRVRVDGLSLERLRQAGFLQADGIEGRLHAGIDLKGPRERAQMEARAEADGRLRGGPRWTGRAQASGPVSLADGRMDLAWKASLDAHSATGRLRRGRLDLHGMARGPWPPRIEGEAAGAMEVLAGDRTVTLTPAVSMRLENGAYALEGRLAGLGAPVQVSLAGRGEQLERLSLTSDGVDLETLVAGARGRARVTASASGRVTALDGTASLQVAEAAWREVVLGTVSVEATLRRGQVEGSLALPVLGTRATVVLPSGARSVLTGTIDLEATPLAPFAPWLPPMAADLTGELSGRVTFSVPRDVPDRARAQAEIRSLEVRRGQWSARALAPFRAGYAPGEASVEALRLEGPGVRIEADGRAGTGPQGRLDLGLRVRTALGEVPVPEGWRVAGEADADLAITGTVRRPQAHGHVSLRSASLSAPAAPTVSIAEGRVDMEGETVVLPALTASLAGGRLTLSGRFPLAAVFAGARRDRRLLAPEEEAVATLEWSDIDAAALLAQVAPGRGVGLQARLAGRAELRGGLASLAEPSVVVRLPPTQARFQELPLTLEAVTLQLREGRVSTEGLRFTTESGSVAVSGQVDLVRRQAALTGQGQLSLRALSPLLREAALTGTAELDLEARGSFDALHTEGTLALHDATLRLRTIPQPLTGITGLVVFDGGRLQIEEAQASFGGGPVTLGGTARLVGSRLEDARFTLTGRELAVRYPVGLRTRLNADLTLTGRSGALLLAGNVRAQRGTYDLDAALHDSVEASAPSPSPALRSIALDLTVSTEAPISVRGNIGQFRATGRLAVRGDMETPSPIGTLDVERDGQIVLLGKEFGIERGRLTYNGTWDPTVKVDAVEQIEDKNKAGVPGRGGPVKVTVSLEGTLEKPAVSLRSDPPLHTQPEIVSLIAVEDSTDRAAQTALGTEAASFLVGGRLSRGLRRLGFDEVSIQPQLVGREDQAEAGARVTFGKRLSNQVRVIYSASLVGPEDRFVSVEATPTRNVTLSARRTDDGNLGAGAGQTFRWGGPPRARASDDGRGRARLRDVRLASSAPLDAQELRRLLKAKEGDRRTIWQLQDDADRLREILIERGYLEAEVDVHLEEGAAVFQVRSGARYTWQVLGMADPPDLGREIRRALFEEEALERGRERLLRALRERGHLRARVDTRVQSRDEGRVLVFGVDAGPRLQASLRFPGATVFSEGKLGKIAGGPGRVLGEPDEAQADLEAAYRTRHYFTARIDPPRITEGVGRVVIEVPVHEGPRAHVAEIRFEGASRPEDELRQVVPLRIGRPYDEAAVLTAADALRAHYFGLGFPAVRVSARAVPRGADLDLIFEIAEGRPARVGSVVVEGATRTHLGFVRARIPLKPGDPVDPRALSDLESRLLDLGVFSRVAVSVSADDPAKVTVTVEEGERVAASYLLRYDQETVDKVVRGKVRGDVDAEVRNLFGRGLRLGGRYGLGPDIEDVRSDLHLPSFLGQDGINLSVSRRVRDLPGVPGEPPNQLTERGLHLQSQLQVAARWQLLYGYRFRRSEQEAADFVIVTDVGAIDLSAVNDTRDNRLDARRGRFLTLSLEYSPPVLGKLSGNFNLVKGTAQLFLARPLAESLTWAHGYRLGLAHGFKGQPVPFFERFKAGGGNSVRGFATDSLGPLDARGTSAGGKAFVVVNQELRYHHARSGLGAVAFYDAGDVFETRPSLDLRHSAGFGLRWESPVGLLRLDVGFPLKARADRAEKARQIFLSIGQAF